MRWADWQKPSPTRTSHELRSEASLPPIVCWAVCFLRSLGCLGICVIDGDGRGGVCRLVELSYRDRHVFACWPAILSTVCSWPNASKTKKTRILWHSGEVRNPHFDTFQDLQLAQFCTLPVPRRFLP